MHFEVKRQMITSTIPHFTLRAEENIQPKSRLYETFIGIDIRILFTTVYRVNFSGSSDIKIYSICQLQRVLRDTKRNKYGSAVKCGTAGKRKCGKVRYCGVKGYAVKCGTAGQGVKEKCSKNQGVFFEFQTSCFTFKLHS